MGAPPCSAATCITSTETSTELSTDRSVVPSGRGEPPRQGAEPEVRSVAGWCELDPQICGHDPFPFRTHEDRIEVELGDLREIFDQGGDPVEQVLQRVDISCWLAPVAV